MVKDMFHRNHNSALSSSVIYHWIVNMRNTTGSTIVEQELLTLPEHLSSLSLYSGVCIAQYLVFYIVFCRSLFIYMSLCPFFFFIYCVVCLFRFTASDYSFFIYCVVCLFRFTASDYSFFYLLCCLSI